MLTRCVVGLASFDVQSDGLATFRLETADFSSQQALNLAGYSATPIHRDLEVLLGTAGIGRR